jgi:nucleoside phosphorylase
MHWTFPSLRFGLMVGIGGGVPSYEHDIRLGDVVVSQPTGSFGGVIQYDFGKTVQRGRFQRTGSLNKPPKILLSAVSAVQVQHDIDGPQFLSHLAGMAVKHPRLSQKTVSPGIEKDHLFKANYNHSARKATCEHCRTDCLVIRGPPGGRRPLDGRPFVHYGLIASGNQVMKDGMTRERLRKELGVLCFEMEAAGLMDDFPCLVIRGICDYADSHKHKEWQSYAAAMAAAYAKELLLVIPPGAVAKEAEISTLVTGMNSKVDELLIAVRSQKSMQLMDRLSSVNFWDKQHDVYSRAQPGTSTWFLGDPTFKSWLAAQDGVLWCRGLPGTGKTVLASIVINHLVTTFENENVGLAWIYLDYSEHDSQTVEISFASLLRQLIQKDGIVSESMITSIGVSWREGKPNRTAYKSMLQRALQQYSKTIIVIDALDELRDPFLRKDLISELRRLTPAVNLLITSQPLRDIHDILDDTPQIEILPCNEDVKKSLECELQNSENLRKLDPSLQQTITTRPHAVK